MKNALILIAIFIAGASCFADPPPVTPQCKGTVPQQYVGQYNYVRGDRTDTVLLTKDKFIFVDYQITLSAAICTYQGYYILSLYESDAPSINNANCVITKSVASSEIDLVCLMGQPSDQNKIEDMLSSGEAQKLQQN